MSKLLNLLFILLLGGWTTAVSAQQWIETDDGNRTNRSSFRAIEALPAPNTLRNAAGAPGPDYWQQQVDYDIEATLDTVLHRLEGSEVITYHNNSPDVLTYVWIQLDQNVRSIEHSRSSAAQGALPEELSPMARRFLNVEPFDGGYELGRVAVATAGGAFEEARYTVNNTIMKVHLAAPIATGEQARIRIDWAHNIPDDGRGAKEKVRDGWLYEHAQWFPRASVYDDVNGWQTDQFLGSGEFYLNFGRYDVKLTVPRDHLVEATGTLMNPEEVLTATQRQRLARAYQSETPVFIVGPDEVMDPRSRPRGSGMLTWHFQADQVRDFAWVSSKTYVWDAAGYTYPASGRTIKVHSLYPRDAMPLWDKVSTLSTIQTLKTYGRMSLEYPYPKAANIHGPVFGMEYPMIAFCGARPNPDGTYSEGLERALISVTIHEVGHNWFPMIIASDERKWTWMDEGLNSFVQYYAEQDYAQTYCGGVWSQTEDCTYPSRRGPAPNIVPYMQDPDQMPIMTESDYITRQTFGNNGYSKPAAGLVMLREHLVNTDLFDEAFREYSQRWAFKHPQPADFFRSIEEGTGENLQYFWRGWFYTTRATDQAITSVTRQASTDLLGDTSQGAYYYRLTVENVGDLLMPIEFLVTYDDGSTERITVPVEAWRTNERSFTKGFFSNKTVRQVDLDPDEKFADIDRSNNHWEATSELQDAER